MKIKNTKIVIDQNEWILETAVKTPKGIERVLYEAVLKIEHIEGDFYGYSLEGVNLVSNFEFNLVNVANKRVIEVKFAKFGVVIE
ncbi:MAG: hypothetical protein ACRCZ2_07815 [Fusobacteriaceae bacterium]